eukprot:4142672-Pyramimonas_sp.AAC.1
MRPTHYAILYASITRTRPRSLSYKHMHRRPTVHTPITTDTMIDVRRNVLALAPCSMFFTLSTRCVKWLYFHSSHHDGLQEGNNVMMHDCQEAQSSWFARAHSTVEG